MAAKIAPTKRQPAGVVAGSDAMLHKSDERLREIIKSEVLKNLEGTSNQPKPAEDLRSDDNLNEQPENFPDTNHQSKSVEDLSSLIPRISERLDDKTSDGARAIQSQTKRRPSQGFARYLLAICIGVAGTLAWQSYGETSKQIIAANAPELGWSPKAKQMIANWVQQLGWTKPPVGPENTDAQLSVPKMPQAASETVANPSTMPAAPSLDQEQVQKMEADIVAVQQTVEQRLAAVRATVEQLVVGQDQVLRQITKLHQEILNKIPASPPPRPVAAPTRKPTPIAPPTARAPIPPPHP